jgi:hypothetical protein
LFQRDARAPQKGNGASVGYRAPTIGGAMNKTLCLDWLVVQSRFVKSDDNVGFQRDARAPQKYGAYAGLL